MKTHKFDVEDAKKYGIEKAILLEHLKFHQQSNQGNSDLTFKGKTYAFLKKETLEKMYPYLSYKSVTRWLRELEDDGVIESCKPKAKQGNHLKYYHIKGISQNEISESQNETFQNSQNETSSILPNETYNVTPSKNDLIEYFTERGDMIKSDIPLEAENFINHYEDREWKNSDGKKIKSWKRQASTWNNNYQKFNAKRLEQHQTTNKVIDGGTW